MSHCQSYGTGTGYAVSEPVAIMFGFVPRQQYPVTMEPVVSATRPTVVGLALPDRFFRLTLWWQLNGLVT